MDWRGFDVLDTNKNEYGISIASGNRLRGTLPTVGGLRSVHLRRCNHRDTLGRTVPLSRDNGQLESQKAPTGAMSDPDCCCSLPHHWNLPQRTKSFISGRILGRVVAVAFCFVAVDPSAMLRPEAIAVVTSPLRSKPLGERYGLLPEVIFNSGRETGTMG